MKLKTSFYQHDDVVGIARQLLGKFLFSSVNGITTGGMIVETEAYKGPEDRGSHAYLNRKTKRTKTMFEAGGISYVYICYGIHDMFNVVTGKKGSSHAILIRGIEPLVGIEEMMLRRAQPVFNNNLCAGPGSLAKAMGITKELNGKKLNGTEIWIEDRGVIMNPTEIIAGPRVGMNFDGPYKLIPWRFRIKGNKFVSKAK